ncbi:MAG: ABC transporter substrate-binding protein [Kiritimatiellae bacterium]|nr:ABC transporter substrate-binding protein [Kiritimatiellia bacterium]
MKQQATTRTLLVSRFFTAALLVCLSGCSVFAQAQGGDAKPAPVRIALQWLPQSQFAGFYMALEKGRYREAGLDVVLLHTGPGPSSHDFLVQGKADFSTLFLADAVFGNGKPAALANVAQFSQRSNLLLVAWKDMGIEKPADLDGRTVSYWQSAFSMAFDVFFRQQHIRPVAIPQHYSVNLFLKRGVAACAAMTYNEYHRIYQAGVDYDRLTVFKMRDFGLGFPEDGLYTLTETAKRKPEVCRALREATLAGWEYARRHPDEAVETVVRESRRAGVPVNRPHTLWMLSHVLDSVCPPEAGVRRGHLDRSAYTDTVRSMIAAGVISQAPPFEDFAPFEAGVP